MKPLLPLLVACVFACTLHSRTACAEEPKVHLKDNDVWVMAGDSITIQCKHTNFIEEFYRARHPEWHLHFRNSGVGGNRARNVLSRFDYDIAAWKPTIVSVELGMNDVGGPLEDYLKGIKELIAKIRAIPAQPVLISSSPMDDGSKMGDWKSTRCQNIDPFTNALQQLAKEENVVFVDQYHPLIDVWGENRRKGAEAAAKNPALLPKPRVVPAPTPGPDGVTPPPKPTPPILPLSLVPLGGDTIHVGNVGHYNMAATILKGLGESGAVSSATLGADGSVLEQKQCKITDVSVKDGKLSFTRLDEAGPWSIPPDSAAGLKLLPDTLELSQYLLRVTGLPEATYRIRINGKPAATVTSKELAAGWNMTTVNEGELKDRGQNIYRLIGQLHAQPLKDWRAASKAGDAAKLAEAQKTIDGLEAQIQAAIQPVPLKFEIER